MMKGMDISLLANLPDRDLAREGICVGEGRFAVERMLASGLKPLALASVPGMADGLTAPGGEELPLQIMPQPEIGRIAGFPFHRGLLGAFERPRQRSLSQFEFDSTSRLVLLDGVTDPVNVGGIIRSALAFELDGLILGPRCGDPYSRRAIRASMAACFSLPLIFAKETGETARQLKARNLPLWGADLRPEARPVEALSEAEGTVLILGNEGHGISDPWREACDAYVMIPVAPEVDSLNVGVAAGILLHQLARTKRPVV